MTPIVYQIYPFVLTGPQKQAPIHSFRVEPDGTVAGHNFETVYRLLESVVDYGEFLGFVVCDGHDGFIETRIPIDAIKEILQKGGKA